MKAAIVYHRIDFDGICAYAAARKALEKNYETVPYPYTYGDKEIPSAEELLRFDKVVILDVCLPAETMRALFKAATSPEDQDVVWIDHHKSSIELSVREGFSLLHGYRQPSGKGACELAWEYFINDRRVPLAIRYLSAYDVHDKARFDWDREVMPFQYGMREAYALRAEDFAADIDLITRDEEFMARILDNGGRIYRYAKDSGGRGVSTWGFPVTVAGKYKGLCCLTNQFGSLAFEQKMRTDGYDLAVCANRLDADTYVVSIYAPDKAVLDIGRYLADTYGGGGHPGAGSCRVNLETFTRLLTKATI